MDDERLYDDPVQLLLKLDASELPERALDVPEGGSLGPEAVPDRWRSLLDGLDVRVLLQPEDRRDEGPLAERTGVDDKYVVRITLDSGDEGERASELLLAAEGLQGDDADWDVELFAEQPVVTPGGLSETSSSLTQGYLESSSDRGVGLRPFRQATGEEGLAGGLVLVEVGCETSHGDLPGGITTFRARHSSSGGSKPWSDDHQDRHGNAMLGILCASAGRVEGFVPGVKDVRVGLHRPVTPYSSVSSSSVLDLVREAVDRASPGDVLVVGLDAIKYRNWKKWYHSNRLSFEAWYAARRLFHRAARKNVYVVCAAGNGLGFNLDCFCSPGLSPSPAIVVGAARCDRAERLPDSNCGNRVDLHSWGEKVATLTDTGYTASFNGTSSATAIVAGCVAVLGSYVKREKKHYLRPSAMRRLLVETGAWETKGVGRQPDLMAALTEVDRLEDSSPLLGPW